jgi:2-dehydro-3-deoxyphosphogalactonate aldolase
MISDTTNNSYSANPRLAEAMERLPLVAILRGIKPLETVAIGRVLAERGFTMIEVPLNSPEPFVSIKLLRNALPADVLVGAGTVTDADDVAHVRAAGGELIVMPHADVTVIAAAKAAGMIAVPGIATPTEAFAALKAGADALKLFPAELITPPVLKAMLAVLPKGVATLPVGGITTQTMRPYIEAGAKGFGLGSALYKPGMSATDVGARADAFVTAWKAMD